MQHWGKVDRNRGEAAAIVLARRLNCVAVVDDGQGRRVAKELHVAIVGTVGILARIAADGRLTTAENWTIHPEIMALGFRSPFKDARDFVDLVERLGRS